MEDSDRSPENYQPVEKLVLHLTQLVAVLYYQLSVCFVMKLGEELFLPS